MTRALPRVNFFYIKNIKKDQDLKVLGLSTKLYPRVLGLAATPDSIYNINNNIKLA